MNLIMIIKTGRKLPMIHPQDFVFGRATPERIKEAVGDYFGVNLHEKTRRKQIMWPRQLAMYFTREFTGLSLTAIGDIYKKDHATVLHACRKVKSELRYYDDTRELIETIKSRI